MKKYKKNVQESNSDNEEYEAISKWYNEEPLYPKSFNPVTEQVLIELKEEAKKCLDSSVANYNIKNSKVNSNYQWMKTVMAKGTVSDKIAAHTVAIQDNPLACLDTLRNLVGMVKVGKKKECTSVIETLTELFLAYLLKPDEKLKAFHQKPLSLLNDLSSGNAITRRKILSLWYFEDQLKEIYTSFILALNTAAQDTVDSNKEKALRAMYQLLSGNPEQEKNLLSYIVNKLGDPSQKVASKAIYCLTQLLFKHSNMQGVVLNEVEKILFRPNISTRTQYYSLCFLSQYYLSHEASDVAKKLIEVYFSFFKACIKKGEVDSRMMSALLMGINRAYPYAKLEDKKISEHIDTIYRLVHLANFNISLQALTLLYQVSDFEHNVNDRFYSALYKKLRDPALLTTTHQAMLLSLVYKTLLKDKEVNRIKVFVKRLLQIALNVTPSFTFGILYLISNLIKKKQDILALTLHKSMLNQFEDDDEDEKYHDIKEVVIKEEPSDTEEHIMEPSQDLLQTIDIDDSDEIKPDTNNSLVCTSWFHARQEKSRTINNNFNPLARNPLYAGGEFCAYTELIQLQNHFHPTIALHASNIVKGDLIKYDGDPLKDFTLIRFLDRFVFKNPKKINSKPGVHPTFGQRKLYKPKGVRNIPVNSNSYITEHSENIPVDEKFMYSYLKKKYENRAINNDNDDSDTDSVQSEEFEEMLDKMGGDQLDDNEIDFMNEIGDTLKFTKRKDKNMNDDDPSDEGDAESSDNDDLDEMDDASDFDDLNDEDKELIGDVTDDEDEDMVFSSDNEDSSSTDHKKKLKNKFKKGKSDLNSLFASADEFATLLEDEGSAKTAPGSSNAFSNTDQANQKQLNWEEDRNRWLNGYNKAMGKKSFQKTTGGFKKRPNFNKSGNKKKKFKK